MRNRHEQALRILHEGTMIPAVPLALNERRAFDERRQRALIRYYMDCGVGGIAVAVHTTQFEIRKPEIGLLEPVLRVVSEEMAAYERRTGRTLVRIAGACGLEAQAVEEARLARQYGFDAVLLSPGGLGALSEAQLVDRTRRVAEEMPVIGFYLQPSVGGRIFTQDYWRQICAIPNVVAIKSAPFNRYQTLDLVRAAACSERAEEIALYTGNDDNIVLDLLTPYRFRVDGRTVEKRFVGGLLGHWSVWTKTAVELYARLRAYQDGRPVPQELLSLAAAVTDCNGAFFDVANGFKGCIAGIHEVLRRQGLFEGTWCLNEEETLSPGQSGEIDRVYAMYGELSDDAFVAEHLDSWLN